MVQWQLCTLEHLKNSGFGLPCPRHGLQLLFWFANHCVTFELVDYVETMMLTTDCQPENGFYGFHPFGNIEELLPVLKRPKKNKKKVSYYEVGNLNKEASANLPSYVRENYELYGNRSIHNIDRIIISYQVRTRVVEAVYVTEHDPAAFGRFRPDGTHGISCELMRALQSPQLDLSTFLVQMGYYVTYNTWDSSAQQMFNAVQTYTDPNRTYDISPDLNSSGVFSGTFRYEQPVYNRVDVTAYNRVDVTAYNSRLVAKYMDVYKKRKSCWGAWQEFYKGFEEAAKKRRGGGGGGGGGVSFLKVLLAAGALYLAVKCFSSLMQSCSDTDVEENVLKVKVSLWSLLPWRTLPQKAPSHVHIMLDYVY